MERLSASLSHILGALVCALPVLACSDDAPPAPLAEAKEVPPTCCLQEGDVARGWIPSGTVERFAFTLVPGDALEVVALQEGGDVALLVVDPGGHTRMRLDRPVGRSEPEHLVFVAEARGTHVLEVESLEDPGERRYHLEVRALGPATNGLRLRAAAVAAQADGHERRREGAFAAAVGSFREAARRWQGLGDLRGEADALDWAAYCLGRDGRHEPAVPLLRRAIRGFDASGQLERQAVSLGELGDTLRTLGRVDEALAAYREALPRWHRLDDPEGEAGSQTDLANLHKARNELSAAELRYRAALALWEGLGRARAQAITLANLAGLYSLSGQPKLALDLLERASGLLGSSGSPGDRAFLLEETGLAHRKLGQWDEAAQAYRKAWELHRREESSAGAARALEGLGRLRYEAGDYEAALGHYLDALSLVEPSQDRLRAAVLLQQMGLTHLHRGEPGRALESFQRALPGFQEADFPAGEAATLGGIARVERELGHLEAALEWAERSLELIEELRHGSDRLDLRTSLLATKQSYFDFAIDTLMELHRREPRRGFAERAFHVSERGRARALLDTLPGPWREAPADSSGDRSELASLRERVNSAEERRLALLADGAGGEALERAEDHLRAALEKLRSATGRLPEARSRASATRALTLEEVQRALLEPGTLLLSYDLGEERSYLWAVARSGIETFTLPAGEEIERQSRRLHDLLARSRHRLSRQQVEIRAARLGEVVLRPAASLIAEHGRLLVSAEGDLHLVPFGALPDPAHDGRALLAAHEIAHAPSASALVWIGRRPEREAAGLERTVAILADPVFGPDDPRVAEALASGSTRPASGAPPALGGPDLARLPYTAREAEAVLSLVDSSEGRSATSFEADKELVLGGELSGYRVLHFATHGWFSGEHPELSALVLSRFRPDGQPRDGILWAHEIAALDLPADLVVLNACETGLGASLRGEGLVGLSDAFFRAGARQVLVSLWRLDDRAAVELMTRFYQGFLEEGLPASEALRRAQLAVRADPRWERPYYWAGFVLQGEG